MPIPLRTDFDAQMVRSAARRSKDGPQARRLLTLAAIYKGATRTEAAKIGGVTLQIVRDWVVKFNAHGPDGLIERIALRSPRSSRAARSLRFTASCGGGFVDLCQWIFEEFRVVVSKQTWSRELRAMGYRKLSARPRHHAQVDGAIEDFKKVSPRAWKRSAAQRASIPTR
jgi:transposase